MFCCTEHLYPHCDHSYDCQCTGSPPACSHSQHRPHHPEGLDQFPDHSMQNHEQWHLQQRWDTKIVTDAGESTCMWYIVVLVSIPYKRKISNALTPLVTYSHHDNLEPHNIFIVLNERYITHCIESSLAEHRPHWHPHL